MLEHVHLEDESVQNQLLISGGLTPCTSALSRSLTEHLSAEAQRPSTSTGLTRTASFSASIVDGHWIMLRLCPSRKLDWQRFWTIKHRRSALQSSVPSQILQICLSKDKLKPIYWVGHHFDSGSLRSELQVLYSDQDCRGTGESCVIVWCSLQTWSWTVQGLGFTHCSD